MNYTTEPKKLLLCRARLELLVSLKVSEKANLCDERLPVTDMSRP